MLVNGFYIEGEEGFRDSDSDIHALHSIFVSAGQKINSINQSESPALPSKSIVSKQSACTHAYKESQKWKKRKI